MTDFKIIFFNSTQKEIGPIERFLNKSNIKLRVKILRQLQYLQEFGITRSLPNLKKLTSTPFWELRIHGKQEIRIFCYARSSVIYLIHIFHKKSKKTPPKEISIAYKRLKNIVT